MPVKVYTAQETPIVFQDSGGDAVITLANLSANTGRISARYDRGAGSIATWYLCRVKLEKGVAGVVGEVISIYLSTSDGTNPDGNVGTADAPLTTAQTPNLILLMPLIVTTTSTNTPLVRSVPIWIPSRYFSVGLINSATGLLRNSANFNTISFTPLAEELQTT